MKKKYLVIGGLIHSINDKNIHSVLQDVAENGVKELLDQDEFDNMIVQEDEDKIRLQEIMHDEM